MESYPQKLDRRFEIATTSDGDWQINNVPVNEDLEHYLNVKHSKSSSICPLCSAPLRRREFYDVLGSEEDWHFNREYEMVICSRCSHWEFGGSAGGNKCMDTNDDIAATSVAGRFNAELPLGCVQEIAQQLRRNPRRWHELDPKKFELLLTEIFRANHAQSEVFHVGKPGDRGVDVLFIDSGGRRWLVQAKRRSKLGATEGFATLQSILGTMTLENSRHAIIASTVDKFSAMALREKNNAAELGYHVDFVDKGKLDRMIGKLLPRPPWEELFSSAELAHLEPDVVKYFYDGNQPDLFESW